MSRSPGGSYRYNQSLSSDDNDAALISSTVCMDCYDSTSHQFCILSRYTPNSLRAESSDAEPGPELRHAPLRRAIRAFYHKSVRFPSPWLLRLSSYNLFCLCATISSCLLHLPTPPFPHPELPVSITAPPAISGSRLELPPELRIQQVQDVLQQARTWTLVYHSQQAPKISYTHCCLEELSLTSSSPDQPTPFLSRPGPR